MTDTKIPPKLLRATEVAELLTISRTGVYRLIEAGHLRAVYPSPGCTRFRSEDVAAYIEKVTEPRPQDRPASLLSGRRTA